MTVEDARIVHSNLVSISGPYQNKKYSTNRLIDELGNVYDAHIPFVRPLVSEESTIILGIYGAYDVDKLVGRVLKSAD